MGQVTQVLTAMERGEPHAAEELLPLVYEELRHLAACQLAREKPGHTLQATALVHEAWLRVSGPEDQRWANKGHFFGAAAEAMRRILVENARRKQARKRGAAPDKADLDIAQIAAPVPDEQLLALDEALADLTHEDPQAAQLVKLRFFVGLTHREAAAALGVSHTVADRIWLFAKAWLAQRINSEDA